jgi:hypothetical protein
MDAMTNIKITKMSKGKKVVIGLPIILLAFYAISAFILFDFTEAAYPHDEEYFRDKLVAYGPCPRVWVRLPDYQAGYSGHEWPFFIYRPVCSIWRSYNGYATPAEWRSN